MTRLASIIVALSLAIGVKGASYYVATNGNDAAAGTVGAPWATIGKATATAAAGDTVNVGAGVFSEFITNTVSGAAGNPITFTGTRSGTNWLTIIDPSTPMTNGWVSAPEIGAGVYKHTGTFITRELTIGNQRVAAIYDIGDISASLNQAYASPGITTGTQVLALASSATMTNLHGHVVTFWDGVEAMWGTVSTNTYLRLRNGSDPNGLSIRVSPNHPSLWTTDMVRPAINVNASYVTWRNFIVRNAFGQFYVQGSGNVIDSNYLSAGYCRVRIFSGSGNTIQNNEATANYYGWPSPGAWQFASGATNVIREQLYDVSKFLMGVDTSFDEGIDCLEAGANNLVAYNHVYGGIGIGVSAFANLLSYVATTNLVVCSNVISGHPSAGVLLSEGISTAKVFNNSINDCNISVRFNHLDSSLDSSRVAYVYRNRLWNPTSAGEGLR